MKNKHLTLVSYLKVGITSIICAILFTNNVAYMSNKFDNDLLDYTNIERVNDNKAKLVYSEQLSQAANNKINNMFFEQYWAHNSVTGKTPWYFIHEMGYEYEKAGENLAKNYYDAKNVVKAWMQSEGHKRNILDSEFTQVGFATKESYLNGKRAFIVVAMYAKPHVKVQNTDTDTDFWANLLQNISVINNLWIIKALSDQTIIG